MLCLTPFALCLSFAWAFSEFAPPPAQKPEIKAKTLSFEKDNRAQFKADDARRSNLPVEVVPDQELHLVLPVTPGTGATWRLAEGNGHLDIVSKQGGDPVPKPEGGPTNPKPRVGGGESRLYRFRATKKGKTQLKLVLTLPNGEGGPTFVVPIEVK